MGRGELGKQPGYHGLSITSLTTIECLKDYSTYIPFILLKTIQFV